MKKNLLTRACALAAMTVMAIGANAQETYAIDASTTYTGNETNLGTTNCTLTIGSDTWTTKSEKSLTSYGFSALIAGNTNPTVSNNIPTAGTYVTLTPAKAGTLTVGLIVNASKAFYITDGDGNDLSANATYTDKSGSTQTLSSDNKFSAKFYGVATFSVEAGKSYNVYTKGSKISFYGFIFTETPSYTLTTSDTEFYSLYLNFAAAIPSGITAYRGNGSVSDGKLSLTQITDGVIPATEAVLVKSESAGDYTFESSSTEGTKSNSNPLLGVLEDTDPTTLATTGKIVLTLGKKDGVVGFRQPYSGDKVLANKAYLLVDETSGAKGISIMIGDETTGISEVVSSAATEDAPVYNLAGQRVSGSAKGLLIKNGKKYVK